MTDDEIGYLIDEWQSSCGEIDDYFGFARAIAAKEREACAEIVDAELDEWESRDICAILQNVVREIRARGE